MKWIAIAVVGLGLNGAVSGFATEPQATTDAQRRATCMADGGTPHYYGTGLIRWFCDKPFPDAGKACAASADCAGECVLPDDYKWVRGYKPLTIGTCQARTKVGCMTILRDGLPTHYCID